MMNIRRKTGIRRIFLTFAVLCMCAAIYAQPERRRVQQDVAKEKKVDRASLQFPVAVEMPEDVVWRRDLYRQIDLTLDKNAPLYYPMEPSAGQINLFTYLFDLLLTGKINAYAYKLDGNESFSSRDKIQIKEILDRYHIYYEEKNGRLQVNASDIPSAEVSRYFIKETSYFDQRTSSFHRKVTAICPVLVRGDEFGGEATPYPLFWLNYDEISPYLAKHQIMGSNYNNVINMSTADYFAMNRYEGKIYKTNNLQGRVLANYCKTDSALVNEQKKIEKQLSDFENGVWGHTEDSIQTASAEDSKQEKTVDKKADKEDDSDKDTKASEEKKSSRRKSTSSESTTTKKSFFKSSSSSSSAPRVSVRRQRR